MFKASIVGIVLLLTGCVTTNVNANVDREVEVVVECLTPIGTKSLLDDNGGVGKVMLIKEGWANAMFLSLTKNEGDLSSLGKIYAFVSENESVVFLAVYGRDGCMIGNSTIKMEEFIMLLDSLNSYGEA